MKDLLKSLRDRYGYGYPEPPWRDEEAKRLDKAYVAALDSKPTETEIQAFLEDHPLLVAGATVGIMTPLERVAVFAKVPLAEEYVTDFAVVHADSDGARWTFIELEGPDDALFTRGGDPSAKLRHGMRQLEDWSVFIQDNPQFAKRRMQKWHSSADIRGPSDVWRAPTFKVIIGRAASLTPEARRRKASMNDNNPRIQIATYDRLRKSRWADPGSRPVFGIEEERGQLEGKPWPKTPKDIEYATSLKYYDRLDAARESTPDDP
jgi:hypothetical protein